MREAWTKPGRGSQLLAYTVASGVTLWQTAGLLLLPKKENCLLSHSVLYTNSLGSALFCWLDAGLALGRGRGLLARIAAVGPGRRCPSLNTLLHSAVSLAVVLLALLTHGHCVPNIYGGLVSVLAGNASTFLSASLVLSWSNEIHQLRADLAKTGPHDHVRAERLITSARRLVSSFGPQLFVFILTSVLSLFIRFLQVVCLRKTPLRYHVTVVIDVWPLLSVLITCHYFRHQTEDYYERVYRHLIEKNRWRSPESKMLVYLRTRSPVDFWASGIIQLDYPLLHSLTAALAAYLVVLIQM